MRHGKKFNHLSRKTAHRKAMLANMGSSLIEHKRINTTLAKAKALKLYIEPLVTKAKHSVTTKNSVEEGTHLRRVVFRYLRDKHAVNELFTAVAPKVADRSGGYTRIIKTGFRKGDGAEMAMIELVDFNEIYTTGKEEKKTRRSRRGGKKSSDGAADDAAKPEAKKADAKEAKPAKEAPKKDAPAEDDAATEE